MSYMSGRWLMKKKILIAVLVLGIAFSNVTIGTAGKDMPAGGDTFSVQEKLPVKFTQYFSDRAGKDAEAVSEKNVIPTGAADELVYRRSGNEGIYMLRGLVAINQHKYKQAIKDYTKAIELNPDSALAYYARATAYSLEEDFYAAEQDYNKALKKNPEPEMRGHILLGRGVAYVQLGETESCLNDFDEALKYLKGEEKGKVYSKRGLAYLLLGEMDKSYVDFEKALSINTKDVIALISIADLQWLHYHAPEKALPFLDRAVAADSSNLLAWMKRGKVLLDLHEDEKALMSFNKGHVVGETDGIPYLLRNMYYMQHRRFTDARNDLTHLISIYPNNAYFYSKRCDASMKLHDFGGALEDIRKAIALEPDKGYYYMMLGLVYSQTERYDEAITAFETAIAKGHKKADVYNNLGYVYKLKGNYQKALGILNKAIEMDPGYGESYRSRGEVYAEMGEYEKAVADITEFLKINPNIASALLMRAGFYDKLGKKEWAEKDRKAAALGKKDGIYVFSPKND